MYKIHWTVQLREQCKKSKQFLLCKYCVSNAEKRWDPVNSIPQFFVTKRLQLRFKKKHSRRAKRALNFVTKFLFIVHCCTWCKRFIKWEWMLALHCVYYVWVLKERWSATTSIFFNGYVFHNEEYRQGWKTYNSDVCFKGSTSSEFEVDYDGKLKEIIELQYHSKHNRVFLFKCYWYDTIDKGIRVDPHHGLVEINSKARLYNVNDVFVFAKQCQQVYYIYTSSFRKDRSRVDWLSVLKTKLKGRVEVVQDENDDSNVRDDIF